MLDVRPPALRRRGAAAARARELAPAASRRGAELSGGTACSAGADLVAMGVRAATGAPP